MSRFVQRWTWCLLCAGCSSPSPESDAGQNAETGADASADVAALGPLIDHEAWTALEADGDPFDDRPAVVDCERGSGWDIELLDVDETIGVDTGACNYLALVQPTLRSVAPGEPLAIQLWHFQLEGSGGPAHVAVAMDGAVVWQTSIPIPSESALTYETFAVPTAAAEGAPIVFHLHNHGLNTWNLIGIRTPDE